MLSGAGCGNASRRCRLGPVIQRAEASAFRAAAKDYFMEDAGEECADRGVRHIRRLMSSGLPSLLNTPLSFPRKNLRPRRTYRVRVRDDADLP